ncbi:MAG: hypothetical protein NTZ71_01035 [Planctomycetota bacterium]|nr:hypothetical protein [Planctomycetota bacterium]
MTPIRETRVREGLSRAALHPEGFPTLATRTTSGLFPAGKEGREAAEFCSSSGWIDVDQASSTARLTPLGWNRLVTDPRLDLVMNELLRQIDSWRDQDRVLLQRLREKSSSVDHLREVIGQLMGHGDYATDSVVLAHLKLLTSAKGMDVPLVTLLESVRVEHSGTSLGAFHDSLRRLRTMGRLHLHAWTGPLHDMPHPEAALMAGHDIAYYASLPDSALDATEGLT